MERAACRDAAMASRRVAGLVGPGLQVLGFVWAVIGRRALGKRRQQSTDWGPGGPPTPPSRLPARDSMGEVKDCEVHDGHVGCHLLVDGGGPHEYVRGAASTSTDVFVRQDVADRCSFRCLHLAATTTISGGGIICAVPKMVISPTPDLLLMCMCLKLSMVLWVSLHTINGISTPLVCCPAHSEGVVRDVFWAGADGHGLDVKLNVVEGLLPFFFDQNLEAISNLHKYSNCRVNCWTHVSIHIHLFRISSVLPLKISDLCFQPMVFVIPDLECQRWTIIFSVSLWSQVNITATILKHHSCSHTKNEIHGQQRSSSCLCARKIIKIENAIEVRHSFFMIPARTKFYLPDDHLVEDVVPPPFGLCYQRCTTTSLSDSTAGTL